MHETCEAEARLRLLLQHASDCLRSLLQRMDPQLRKLLEVAYEAWMDSGINHLALRGSERVRVHVVAAHGHALRKRDGKTEALHTTVPQAQHPCHTYP